ncbi:hypothetical protein [Mumia sp. DW29H23]|uniref:hypothetical protein n=1 Tax=Mumia sp. DW29H23 TaxID=3421241 RepID=UPI003D68E8D5
MATDKDPVRRALWERLGGLALAVALLALTSAFWWQISGTSYGDRGALDRARDQPHQQVVVVDDRSLSPAERDALGTESAIVALPDGSNADLWALDYGIFDVFSGGPEPGDVVEVVVDPDDRTWAADVAGAGAPLLDRVRYLLISALPLLLPTLVAARYALRGGVPLRALRTLRRPRDRVDAEVVSVMHTRERDTRSVTLRLRVGDDEYSWDATLPKGCVPYVGGTLDLHGDVRDKGWVTAVDEQYGTAFPRSRLRQWGAEPPTRTWHPTDGVVGAL